MDLKQLLKHHNSLGEKRLKVYNEILEILIKLKFNETDWQPIETAPKDGTRILAYFPENTSHHYEKGNEAVAILTVAWLYVYSQWRLEPDGATEFEYDIEGKPTHWMPLPKPPTINSK